MFWHSRSDMRWNVMSNNQWGSYECVIDGRGDEEHLLTCYNYVGFNFDLNVLLHFYICPFFFFVFISTLTSVLVSVAVHSLNFCLFLCFVMWIRPVVFVCWLSGDWYFVWLAKLDFGLCFGYAYAVFCVDLSY